MKQKKELVLKNVLAIKFGTTQTYKQIALKTRGKTTPRMVGQILGTNDKLIAVPCHRVVYSDGDIGGYVLGKNLKKTLLEWEKKVIT
ncbi:MAG TPA: methylated-DNA--[protein]-cysteine S-methyltransferase [Candidatus Ratteibacteria bacterium]|nr:methylated-DNA--[protein]-cysteine S-methyltransferase [Candidatus Ratteibacteria bacterium]HRV04925.1 methylated-DNA--[protein]-cysteine S-methyltransferase [Candidatus Ratteibacteria bacterium]